MSRLVWTLVNGCVPEYNRMSRFIRRYVNLSPEDARRESRKLLYRYLQYCRRYSSYWRERWPKEAITFSIDEAENVLALLPILNKGEIREHSATLMIHPEHRQPNDGFPSVKRLEKVRTGGTTGMPVLIYNDGNFRHRGRATVDYFYRLCGLHPGDPFFYLWGSNNELAELSTSWRKRVSSTLRGMHVLPAFGLTSEKVRTYATNLQESPSVHSAICFTSALDTFLAYAERDKLALPRLERVFTGGGLLYETLRQRIQTQIATEVFDTYGSRDFGLMACETPAHDGRSVAAWLNHLEVLDGKGAHVLPGGRGEVHVTAIGNYSFALIRAATGDTAIWHPDPGQNPIPTARLLELGGRVAEHLHSPQGTTIDPSAIIHMVGVLIAPEWLRRFQLAQLSPDQFELRVESWEDSLSPGMLEDLRSRVEKGLMKLAGEPLELTIVRLASISPTSSGKHLYCVKNF